MWRSLEEFAWLNRAPVGREFGSPDFERLMEEDFRQRSLTSQNSVDVCRHSNFKPLDLFDETVLPDICNVQIALQALGHTVEKTVAATVWKHYSAS